jgi:dimethylaniline monooxygenase (N-oxide forming)
MRIAVIGSGISGITAATILKRYNHDVVVFERSDAIGGVWARTYPQVRLQNVAEHYRLSDFPWPFAPDLHPTAEQIQRYLQAVVAHYGLAIRLEHEVLQMAEGRDGWLIDYRSPEGTTSEHFDFAVVAVGHFTQEKVELSVPGRDCFSGTVLTDRDINDLEVLADREVAVVGFGKTAVDMASFAAERGAQVAHIFRDPRWLLPARLFGVHYQNIILTRMNTMMMPAWAHLTTAERVLHQQLAPLVTRFWRMIGLGIRMQVGLHGLWRDPEVRERMRRLVPEQPLTFQMRAAIALAPEAYFPSVIKGTIVPYRSEVAAFYDDGLVLGDGTRVPCDTVVFALGNRRPRFPFLPGPYRDLLESQADGAQLYRHLLHPRIPRLAFAGFNHGILHVPAVEVSMLWLCAYLRGDLALPSTSEMEHSMAQISDWKREHMLFEPTRSYSVNTRFHQYLDVLLADLGLSPYRKRNRVAELVSAYTAADYQGLFDEYEQARSRRQVPQVPLPLHT